MSSGTRATTIFARPCGLNSAAELSDGAIHRIAMKTATRPSKMATPRIMSDCPRATPPSSRNRGRYSDQATARDELLQASDEVVGRSRRSEEHTSELQSLMRISYAVFCLKKKNPQDN